MNDDKRVFISIPLEDFSFLNGVYERSLVLRTPLEIGDLSKDEILAIMFERNKER